MHSTLAKKKTIQSYKNAGITHQLMETRWDEQLTRNHHLPRVNMLQRWENKIKLMSEDPREMRKTKSKNSKVSL